MHYCLLFLGSLLLCANTQYEECATKLSVLEKALYETDSNELALNGAFFPPREETSRYIRVTYRFLINDTEESFDSCNVSYIWSIGGFLIIQPPSVFMFTSLFFSIPANNLTDLILTLPTQCRQLAGMGDKCSCDSDNNNQSRNLDILSQQILQYSKYNNFTSVVRDETSSAQAVCTDNIEQKFFGSGSMLYLSVTLLLPFFIIPYIILFLHNYHQELEEILFKPSNHQHIAGIVVCGLFTSLFILAMDASALAFNVMENMQYAGCRGCKIKNAIFIGLTLFFELLVLLVTLVFIAVVNYRPWLLIWIINHSKIKTYNMYKQNKAAKLWSLVIFMLIPSWLISSHIGYVMVSWLTEPSKSTSIALSVFALYLCIYLATRTCYQRLRKVHNVVKFILFPLASLFTLCAISLIVSAFYFLPLPTLPLGRYIENIAQTFLVLLAALVSYKLITIQESDTQKFLRSFNKQCVGEDIQAELRGTKNIVEKNFTVTALRVSQNGGSQEFTTTLPVEMALQLTRGGNNNRVICAQIQHEIFQNTTLQGEYLNWLNDNNDDPSPWVFIDGFKILPNCMVITFSDNSPAVLLPPYCTDVIINRGIENNNNIIRVSIQLRGQNDIESFMNQDIQNNTEIYIRNISMSSFISISIDGNNNTQVYNTSSFRIGKAGPNVSITPNGYAATNLIFDANGNATIIIGLFRKCYTGVSTNEAMLKACFSTDYDNFEDTGNIVGTIASKMYSDL